MKICGEIFSSILTLLIPLSLSLSLSLIHTLAEVSRMKPIYVDERMEEMDKNKDGKVDEDEYIRESLTIGC